MSTFLVNLKRRPSAALQYFLLELAARHTAASSQGFQMIDGEWISNEAGQAALQNGSAVLVGGLLVGIIPPEF